jgi:hypothetical protein
MPTRGMCDTWISGSDVNSFCCHGLVVVFEKPHRSSFTLPLPNQLTSVSTSPRSVRHNPPSPMLVASSRPLSRCRVSEGARFTSSSSTQSPTRAA